MLLLKISPLVLLCLLAVVQATNQSNDLRAAPSTEKDECEKKTVKLVQDLSKRTDRLEKELKELNPDLEDLVFKVLELKYNVEDAEKVLQEFSKQTS